MIKINKNTILKAIQPLTRIATTKSLPIYECVLILSPQDENKAYLTCMNGEQSASVTVPLIDKTEPLFATCVPSKLLADMLKQLSDGDISFESTDKGLSIDWGAGRSHLYTVDWRDMPSVPQMTEATFSGNMSRESLDKALKSAVRATADINSGRQALSSVNFDCTKGMMNIVASDSHQLICTSFETNLPDGGFLLPEPSANALRAILAESEENDVRITANEGHAQFMTGEFIFTSTLVKARFPKYSGIIPASTDGVLCIDKSLLMGVLKRAAVFSNTATDTITLTFKDGQLNVCADDPAYGMRCDETLQCDYKGPELSVIVKDYLLIEVLNSLQTDRIEIGVSEGLKPIRIRPEEPEQEGESQVAVLMPSTR